MRHEKLTGRILKICFDVSNELGCGFLESVYQKALLISLAEDELQAESQVQLKVMFRNQQVGDFYPDIIVEGTVILELKAVKTLSSEHSAQVLNYLKATGIEVGLLVNFGSPKLEFRRFENNFL